MVSANCGLIKSPAHCRPPRCNEILNGLHPLATSQNIPCAPFPKISKYGYFLQMFDFTPQPLRCAAAKPYFPENGQTCGANISNFRRDMAPPEQAGNAVAHLAEKPEFRKIPYCIARFEGKIERFRVKGLIPEYMYTPERDNRQTAFHAAVSRFPVKSYFSPKTSDFLGRTISHNVSPQTDSPKPQPLQTLIF